MALKVHQTIDLLFRITYVNAKWPRRLHQMHGFACSAHKSILKNAVRYDNSVFRKRVLFFSRFAAHRRPLKTIVLLSKRHSFVLAARCSLLAARWSLLAARCSLLADRSRIFFCAPCSLLAARGPAIKKLKIKSKNMFTKTKKTLVRQFSMRA